MDLTKLASTLLSSDSIKGLTGATGASGSDITSVLSSALPSLLNGAKAQAKDNKTSESFVSALAQHAQDDTSDLSKFLGNVDLKDGSKIIGHLLGSDSDNVVSEVSKKAGVSEEKTSSILSAVAPLLMSLLGQQADEDENKESGIGNLIGAVMDNVDVGELLTGLLTDDNSSSSTSSKKGKKKTGSKKKAASSNSGVGNLVGGLLKGLLK